jgi:flagellum-specific ATP synthase
MQRAGQIVRELMSAYHDKEDLIAIGAYQQGTDPMTDRAIATREGIQAFLRQRAEDASSAEEADRLLRMLAGEPEPDPVAEELSPRPGDIMLSEVPGDTAAFAAPDLEGDSPVRQSALPPLGLALQS